MQNVSISDVINAFDYTLQTQLSITDTPVEVAFFGGTFTALPEEEFNLCLAALARWRGNGLVARARCSTRPDAPADRLPRLAGAGFSTVELGIQSFATPALHRARRGYPADTALQACAAVRAAGLALGVQLMPGMPGVTPEIFIRDVALALEAGAHMLRFYPCQVLRGTELARLWQNGEYAPWTLEQTVDALAEGWLLAHARRVPVIRMGLAPEPGLDEHTLAGPRHPALGALVQGEALCRSVERALHGITPTPRLRALHVPHFCRGHLWGHRASLRRRWQDMGITNKNIIWHTEDWLELVG